MKTTIDIPEMDLKEAIRHTGAKTKKEAIVYVVRDFNRRRRLQELSKMLGTFEKFMTRDELMKGRGNETRRGNS